MSYAGYAATTPLAYYPEFSKIIASAMVLLAFSFVEAGLITAMSILAGFVFRNLKAMGIFLPILLRAGLIVLGLVSMPSIVYVGHALGSTELFSYSGYCDNWFNPNDKDYIEWCRQERDNRRVTEALQTTVSTLADDSIALTANIMRPIGSFLFVVRNLASAAVGLVGYLVLIWITLKMAQLIAAWAGLSPSKFITQEAHFVQK
jgi:hypothetical protein